MVRGDAAVGGGHEGIEGGGDHLAVDEAAPAGREHLGHGEHLEIGHQLLAQLVARDRDGVGDAS